MSKRLYTIGHSTRSFGQFTALLKAHGIRQVIDIRTIPGSRHNPQFNKGTAAKMLRNRGIGYRHMKGLGGLRHARKDSLNTGWKNASFRGYADYMGTKGFSEALKNLEKTAKRKTTALMCAEAVPWRCHRSLVADALTLAGWKVFHITSAKPATLHKPTPFLRVRDDAITYP